MRSSTLATTSPPLELKGSKHGRFREAIKDVDIFYNPSDEIYAMRSHCHICSADLRDGRNPACPRLTPGIYVGKEKMADRRFWEDSSWLRYYRMILSYPSKNICQLSGVAFFTNQDPESSSVYVPWDENEGVVRPDRVDVDKNLLAEAFISEYPSSKGKLTGYIMHTRCWDLLHTHKIWSVTGGDLTVILEALRRKSARDWEKPKNDELSINEKSWPMIEDYGGSDLFFSAYVQRLISESRQSMRREYIAMPYRDSRRAGLCHLPLELLSLVSDSLPSADVSALQTAIGAHMGDSYWRSRISTEHFHEVKALSGKPIDWEYLSSSPERVNARFNEVLPDMWDEEDVQEDELKGRRWVLGQLDQIADLIPLAGSD